MLMGPVPVLASSLAAPALPTLAAAGGAEEAVSPTHALRPALAGLQLAGLAPETAFGAAGAALAPMSPLTAAEAALPALPVLPGQQGGSEGEVSSPAEEEPAATGSAADGGPSYDQLLSESPFPSAMDLAASLSLTPSQLALTPQKTWSLSQLMAMPSLDLTLSQLNLPSSSSALAPLDAGMSPLPPDAGPDSAAPAAAGHAAVEASAGQQQEQQEEQHQQEVLPHSSPTTMQHGSQQQEGGASGGRSGLARGPAAPLPAQGWGGGPAVAPSAGFAEVDDMLRSMPSMEQGELLLL